MMRSVILLLFLNLFLLLDANAQFADPPPPPHMAMAAVEPPNPCRTCDTGGNIIIGLTLMAGLSYVHLQHRRKVECK